MAEGIRIQNILGAKYPVLLSQDVVMLLKSAWGIAKHKEVKLNHIGEAIKELNTINYLNRISQAIPLQLVNRFSMCGLQDSVSASTTNFHEPILLSNEVARIIHLAGIEAEREKLITGSYDEVEINDLIFGYQRQMKNLMVENPEWN